MFFSKKTILAASLISALALAGCASSGNTKLKEVSHASVKAQIKEGVSTQDDVRAYLGDPTSVSFTDSGNEIWTYTYSEETSHASNFIPFVSLFSSGVDVKSKEVVILFNAERKVMRYTMREAQDVRRVGILGKQ